MSNREPLRLSVASSLTQNSFFLFSPKINVENNSAHLCVLVIMCLYDLKEQDEITQETFNV